MPLVNIVSQIPRAIIDQDRGFLHELPRQTDVFRPLTKAVLRAQSAESLPARAGAGLRAGSHRAAGPGDGRGPRRRPGGRDRGDRSPTTLDAAPAPPRAAAGRRRRAAPRSCSRAAERPVLWAGGGVLRAGAQAELRALAERLDAPVCTTYMGRGALPDSPSARGRRGLRRERRSRSCCATPTSCSPSAPSSAPRPPASGACASGRARPPRRAAPSTSAARTPRPSGCAGDAAADARGAGAGRPGAAARRCRPAPAPCASGSPAGLAAMGMDAERELLRDAARRRARRGRDGLRHDDPRATGRRRTSPWSAAGSFLYPLGSGTLGYAWPAAIGAKVGNPDVPVVAVHGDGGFLYATQELATARQHGIARQARAGRRQRATASSRSTSRAPTRPRTPSTSCSPTSRRWPAPTACPCSRARLDGFAGALDRALDVDGPAVTLVRGSLRVAEITP